MIPKEVELSEMFEPSVEPSDFKTKASRVRNSRRQYLAF